MNKHLQQCAEKKERDSEEIMLKIADINVGKMVNCYVCKLEVPIKEIKKHAATCSRNKRKEENKEEDNKDLPVKMKKDIQCDLCQKKFAYNTALYKHFKNVHHQTYKKKEPEKRGRKLKVIKGGKKTKQGGRRMKSRGNIFTCVFTSCIKYFAFHVVCGKIPTMKYVRKQLKGNNFLQVYPWRDKL